MARFGLDDIKLPSFRRDDDRQPVVDAEDVGRVLRDDDDGDHPPPIRAVPLSVAGVTIGVVVVIVFVIDIISITTGASVPGFLSIVAGVVVFLVMMRGVTRCPVPPLELFDEQDAIDEREYQDWADRFGKHFVLGHQERFSRASERRHKASRS